MIRFHKLISKTIIATALLGATFGGIISGINVSASTADKYTNTSNGHTQIDDGSLTLDSVPDFNFGSNKDAAQNNSTDLKLVNQGTNQLKITDYRNKNISDGNNTRWSLNVSASPFSSSQGNSNDSNNWIITFNNQNSNGIQDNANTNIDSEKLTTNNNNGSNNQRIISNGKYGISEFNFNSDNASLSVPNVKPGSNYSTTMNWQLNADPRSSDN